MNRPDARFCARCGRPVRIEKRDPGLWLLALPLCLGATLLFGVIPVVNSFGGSAYIWLAPIAIFGVFAMRARSSDKYRRPDR